MSSMITYDACKSSTGSWAPVYNTYLILCVIYIDGLIGPSKVVPEYLTNRCYQHIIKGKKALIKQEETILVENDKRI